MATPFGQNAQQDPNLVPGWSVQGNVGAQTGYAQPGITASAAALTTPGNGQPGAPNPLPGNVTDILSNPGYADVAPSLIQHGTALASSLVPVPASGTAFTNPVALGCTVVITGGTVTAVKINGNQVGTADGTYTVPGGAQITLTYSAAPTWTWTTQ